jgi:hypothetical protein
MPKTKAFGTSLLVSGTKNFNRLLVLLLVLAATLALGQESALTLALAQANHIPARKSTVRHIGPAANPISSNVPVHARPHQTTTIGFVGQNATDVQFDSRLEKQGDPNSRNLFQFVHRKLYTDGRAGTQVDVAAGFGRTDEVEAGIWKNSGDLEHPGCAYFKASFSF